MNVYVRRLDTQEIVKTLPLRRLPTVRDHERFMRGLLTNMHAKFYVDDSEVVCTDDEVAG